MSKNKSARHHWWPECVSNHWGDQEGKVNWLLPNGMIRSSTPPNFGRIGNGHFIKLGKKPGETTVWDQNFENEFDQADSHFPRVIEWLGSLRRESKMYAVLNKRFTPQYSNQNMFGAMVEALVSLSIRSPMTREAAVSIAERLRGPLPERERNSLITMNMRFMHKNAVQSFGSRGKATVIFSPKREFIFGDGFYHNLTSPSSPPTSARILAPLTPRMAVLYAIPMQYSSEPQLFTLVINAREADILNDVIQVYSSNAIFYRSEQPKITEDYKLNQHMQYSSSQNPVEQLLSNMPGVASINSGYGIL